MNASPRAVFSARSHTLWCALSVPVRLYLGVVFVLAAVPKIADPYQFGLSIATYDILPLPLVNLLAITLPWVEIGLALTLVAGVWTRASALAILGMLLLFVAAIGSALARDLQLSCGCFASQEAGDEINLLTLLRDLAWVACSLFVLVVDDGRFGLDRWLKTWRKTALGP